MNVYVVDTASLPSRVSLAAEWPRASAPSEDNPVQGLQRSRHPRGRRRGRFHLRRCQVGTLVPVRVLDCNGSGSISTVLAGLDWVLADVSNRFALQS